MTDRAMYCRKPGCDRSWPRDPALEVACPDCRAKIGAPCKRPSGHPLFAHGVHGARDLAADAAGQYGVCPSGRCGAARKAAEPVQCDLFGI
ncbi:hypothetical protein [Aminobacter sp. MET-1]|uniref:zinc finger domain-containing protein n=1 Tax=Aminobacter sp. MET-1 TaxID=2951085 RepID=UPI002269A2A0|nr:hypothetical protein [Aminobacter sp. MET-1]MCX8571169.1 hypothetical protein [Aminobacter sp. MET-1]MCX8573333.1 hypothetical protein [Aminobacter sp. MET-1]